MTTKLEVQQKFLNQQKVDIESITELNQNLSKERKEVELANQRLEDELQKEKEKYQEILDSLNDTDQKQLQASQKLVAKNKEMEQMNKLYRKLASEKSALNREKQRI